MTIDKDAARKLEGIYARHETDRRSGDLDARLIASTAQRTLIETLDALGVAYTVLQDFGPSGDFEGFRLRVYAPGDPA